MTRRKGASEAMPYEPPKQDNPTPPSQRVEQWCDYITVTSKVTVFGQPVEIAFRFTGMGVHPGYEADHAERVRFVLERLILNALPPNVLSRYVQPPPEQGAGGASMSKSTHPPDVLLRALFRMAHCEERMTHGDAEPIDYRALWGRARDLLLEYEQALADKQPACGATIDEAMSALQSALPGCKIVVCKDVLDLTKKGGE